jgi:nicotinate-nucleotide--dimethylbenzimidazole phosphoribosyltransferase
MTRQDWVERLGRFANPQRSTPDVPVDTAAVIALIDSYAWDEASKPAPVTATTPQAGTTAAVEASVAVTEPVQEHQEPASDPPVAASAVEPLVAPTAVAEPAPVPEPPPVPVADTASAHEPHVPVAATPSVEPPTPPVIAITATPNDQSVPGPESEVPAPTGSYWDRSRTPRDAMRGT